MGQHIEYAGNVTQRVMNDNNAILHAYMAGGKLYGYIFAKSQFYPTSKGIIFYLTIMVVETLRRYLQLNPN